MPLLFGSRQEAGITYAEPVKGHTSTLKYYLLSYTPAWLTIPTMNDLLSHSLFLSST